MRKPHKICGEQMCSAAWELKAKIHLRNKGFIVGNFSQAGVRAENLKGLFTRVVFCKDLEIWSKWHILKIFPISFYDCERCICNNDDISTSCLHVWDWLELRNIRCYHWLILCLSRAQQRWLWGKFSDWMQKLYI